MTKRNDAVAAEGGMGSTGVPPVPVGVPPAGPGGARTHFFANATRPVDDSAGRLCYPSWLLALCLAPLCAHAGPWAERAAQMNRTEVSAAEAQARGGDDEKDARNKVCVRSIKPAMPGVDWNTDPTAIPYMLYQVGKRTDLPTFMNSAGLDVATDEIFQHTIIYLTSHNRWSFNEKETENLARWLERGGTLWLDDCYLRGSPFADSVRPEVSKMIIGSEPRLLLKDDPLVSDTFRMGYVNPWPGEADFENRTWQYFLSAGRPAVFFSPNDDGCGWEISSPPSASNPIGEGIGHGGDNRQREIMYQWVTSLLLFTYTH
jgi:hypothetical protein